METQPPAQPRLTSLQTGTKSRTSRTNRTNRTNRRISATTLAILLAILLAVTALVSASSGQMHIPIAEVVQSLLAKIGLADATAIATPNADATLWIIRFPRVTMAILVGAALALSGVLMQAIFANPLAEAGIIGVSSGAAFGAAMAIVFGATSIHLLATPVFAFAFALASTLFVYFLSRANGRTEVVTLVLTGVAINAIAGAGLALMIFLGDTQSREQIVFWQLGSLNTSHWYQAGLLAAVMVAGLILSLKLARSLDLLSLGERSAKHLGVNVEGLRIVVIIIVALLVGVSVAFSGIIAFVGLIIPHLLRMVIGPAHAPLLITSALGGALLLTVADLVARTAVPVVDLPIGMLTSLVGGPFFFWLLRKTRKTAGGWA